MKNIGAALTCQTGRSSPPTNQAKDRARPTRSWSGKTYSLRVTLMWANPGDSFKLTALRIKLHAKFVAASRPSSSSKIQSSVKAKCSTFTVLNVGHLRLGTLLFDVKGAKVSAAR